MAVPADAHLFLVVPDDQFRGLLRKYFVRNGFYVTNGKGADHARRVLSGLDFDLIVIDTPLPDALTDALVAELRDETAAPIIALSSSEADCDAARAAGAEAALKKPFEPAFLLDRINRVLDRKPPEASTPTPRLLYLGPLRYDLDRGELWDGEAMVRLTATESALMRLLAAQPGEAMARAALVERLGRPGDAAQDRAIDVQVTRLRRKLEPNPKVPRYLQTVRGAGYLLQPD
ncbi:winged helix-turn-helix domain-containing protein [Anianabacter salinae]|uniref:winged helix-turn-helix domain-containing protein n=1 Tax=Anianabacter salinae TaxID=2851023 RepID=UPI00225DF57B|nr:response regulator transcription factor [Anianabacter salinae]MBV0913601.1 response regulator transcription factor [Anianabacter salinae]